MTHCRAAVLQMNSINDIDANITQAIRLINEAHVQGAAFVHLPENAFYMRASDKDDVPLWPMDEHPAINACREAAAKHGIWVLIGSVFVPTRDDGDRWFNRAVLINAEGAIVNHYDKIHLFDASFGENKSYQESAKIHPGDQVTVAHTPWGKMGMTICYDVRFPHLYRDLAKHGCDMLAIPAAFAHVTGVPHWHVLLRARAIENGAYVMAAAQCGTHPGDKRTYGHAMIINPWGEIIAEGSEASPEVVIADMDMTEVTRIRTQLPTLQHDRAYLPPPDYAI